MERGGEARRGLVGVRRAVYPCTSVRTGVLCSDIAQVSCWNIPNPATSDWTLESDPYCRRHADVCDGRNPYY